MIQRKYAAAAALFIMLFTATAALSGCAGRDVPISSAASGGSATPSGVTSPSAVSSPGAATVTGPAAETSPAPDKTPPEKPVPPETPDSAQKPAGQTDDSYFDDAVFIGDSLTEGFQLHGGINNATYYGFKNLNVKEVFDKPLVKSGGGKITIADALKNKNFGKYYIMLGANELGWVYPEVFTKKYGELIDLIQQVNPDGKIYLQSVLPVTADASQNSKVYSNDRIDYYDELILALAEEKGVTYLNVRESVENESGILPNDAATDGVHLNTTYCLKWADYLREHK